MFCLSGRTRWWTRPTVAHPLRQPASTILIWVSSVLELVNWLSGLQAGATCSAGPRVPEPSGLAASTHRHLLALLDSPHLDTNSIGLFRRRHHAPEGGFSAYLQGRPSVGGLPDSWANVHIPNYDKQHKVILRSGTTFQISAAATRVDFDNDERARC